MSAFVVVGAGMAGAHAVTELREQGYDGRLVLFGAEPDPPYERPPLSKGYLLGQDAEESVLIHPPEWYAEHDVDLRLGEQVTGLDPAGHTVTTASGAVEPYDRLLLATGSAPRRLPLVDRAGVETTYLRTLEDSRRLRPALEAGRRVLVVGGGWIGLEVAAAARTHGCEVTVLETLGLPLLRVLGPEVAQVFADLHREHGVDLRTGVALASLDRSGSAATAGLTDGSTVAADLVVVGIGVVPRTELAEHAGLDVDDGVLVDERLRSSAPDVLAAGDVANALHPGLGSRLRVEHWDNAIEQGKAAARSMLGEEEPYTRLPYFFTDQYDLGMEYVGHVDAAGPDEVVLRGDVPGLTFCAFWLREHRVLAAMHCNDWDAIEPIRTLVGREVDAAALRDPGTPMEASAR